MSARPTLLFWCQHSLGLGHLARSFALCAGLTERFRVVLVSGGRMPDGMAPPAGVDVLPLPPLGMRSTGELVSHDPSLTVEQAQALRRTILLEILATARPAVVFVELFPFGRKKFTAELSALLEAARAQPARPLVVSSLRDILVSRDERDGFDDRAARLANRLFDAVLVHSDPRFARLEETFRPRTPLAVPVHYTGFALPDSRVTALPLADRRPEIVVSAGGGIVGGPLLRAALAAQRDLWPRTGLRMKLVAGPFLPEAEWAALADGVARQDGVELIRTVPDLRAVLSRARASISQCGYNTALDLLTSGVPALVVPFAEPGHDEQTNRALRLHELGALRHLDADGLTGARLGRAVSALLRFTPVPTALRLDGTRETARLLAGMVGGASRAEAAA